MSAGEALHTQGHPAPLDRCGYSVVSSEDGRVQNPLPECITAAAVAGAANNDAATRHGGLSPVIFTTALEFLDKYVKESAQAAGN
jgi:hypothetical protein